MTEEPWNKHIPGDPMPCKCGESVVEVKLHCGLDGIGPAKSLNWGKINDAPDSEIADWRFVERKGEDVIAAEPKPGEQWRHHSGRIYTVLFLTNNEGDGVKDKYPVTVVYQGDNGKRWSGPLSDWHRRMTRVEEPTCATALAALDDPYAALSQHLHGDGDVPPLRITYRNWRGEVGERNIVPQSVWFGATDWHPEPQWLLSALDTGKGAARDFALADFGANDDTWRTRALAAEAEVERLRAATPQRDAEVRRAALEEAAQEADDWFYDAEKDCVTECRLGNAIRALIDPPPRDADTCATPGCTNPPVIRLDDRRLCRGCYSHVRFRR